MALTKAVAEGRTEALAELYRHYWVQACTLALGVGNAADADDIAQEVFPPFARRTRKLGAP